MDNPKPQVNLETEGPLSEKDEQGKAIANMKCLQAEALDKWRRLKQKVTGLFKNRGSSK